MTLFSFPRSFLKRFSIFIFIFFLNYSTSFSNENIYVEGNKNVPTKTILSLAPIQLNLDDNKSVDAYQKKIFETGFFEKVDLSIVNNKLYINLIENPLVNFFYIDGIDQKQLKTKIENLVDIKENSIFQQYLVKTDIKKISTFLNSIGYLKNDISYTIKKIDNNKVNIFYNININKKFKINRIFFIGDKHFKSSTLKDEIFSSEHGWWKFMSNSTTPSEEVINYDIIKLKKFYLDSGFFDVQINSSSIKVLNNNKVNLIYSITAGNKYYFNNVNFFDNSKFLKNEDLIFFEKLSNNIKLDLFNESSLNQLRANIEKYLNINNYDLKVSYELLKIKNSKIDVKFVINDNSEKKIISKIIFIGNSITDDFVIRNNINFYEGDILNYSKVKNSIDKIKGSGLFKNVEYEEKFISTNEINLVIKVEEQPTGEISAGASAGTTGANIISSINEKNFLGRGVDLNGSFSLGTEKILGKVSYADPDFNNTGNSLESTFYIENFNFDESNYENKIIGANISTNYEVLDKVFLNPGFETNYDSLKVNDGASSLVKLREGNFYTSKFFYNISKNTKNRRFNPTDGYVFGFGQGYSILSDIPYLNNRIFGSYFHEYKSGFVGSIKYRLESINSFNDKDIKFSDRLFVSSDNLRGFAQRGIGPKIDSDYVGGNYSFFSSFSSIIPNGLPDKWNAISNVFFDTGNVWGVDDNLIKDSNKIRSSIGLGFSWMSPLGPVSLSYAEPLSKANTDNVEKFNFKIGSAF